MKKLLAFVLIGWFFIAQVPGGCSLNGEPRQFGPFTYKADCERVREEMRGTTVRCFEGN